MSNDKHEALRSMNRKLTDTEKSVLQAAVDDGGILELSGLDRTPGYKPSWGPAARRLSNRGLGWHFRAIGGFPRKFQISDEGRKALQECEQ